MEIVRSEVAAATEQVHDVWSVYDAVFGDQPDRWTWRSDTFDKHLARPDFRLTLAREDDLTIGFAYGYTGNRGEYWPDRVVDALGPAADLPHDRALLSTEAADTPAVRLYTARGWRRIGLLEPGVQVMGVKLRK